MTAQHLIICSHLSLLSIRANPTPRDCWFVSRKIRVDTTCPWFWGVVIVIVGMTMIILSSLSSTFLGNTIYDDLSIRREHCLKVALFHRVGKVGNVEVRRILFRLASHLCLTIIQAVSKKKWLTEFTEFSGLYSEAKTFGNLAILTNFVVFGSPHLGFYHTTLFWPFLL